VHHHAVCTAMRYNRSMQPPPVDIVGEAEVAERLGVKRATVNAWAKREQLPHAEFTVSGQPAWRWTTIELWAEERFGLHGAILRYLATIRGDSTSDIANALATKGRRDVSISRVARDLNAMFQLGLVQRSMHPHDWVITPAGRQALETGNLRSHVPIDDVTGTFWALPLMQGGPFPVGVQLRIRRVSGQREAEVKSPNGEPQNQLEGVLVNSYYPPTGFATWDEWFTATAPHADSDGTL
jgi:predicted DNA-binding transcriptional regulator AlpA